jgi:hypothetical protein
MNPFGCEKYKKTTPTDNYSANTISFNFQKYTQIPTIRYIQYYQQASLTFLAAKPF